MCIVFSLNLLTTVQAARYLPQFTRLDTITSTRRISNNHTEVEVKTETLSDVRLLQLAENFYRGCGTEEAPAASVENVVPVTTELESAFLNSNIPVLLALVRADGPMACPDGDGVDVVVQSILERAPETQWTLGNDIGTGTHIKIRLQGIDAQGRLV